VVDDGGQVRHQGLRCGSGGCQAVCAGLQFVTSIRFVGNSREWSL
jgi:hypothetical protein